MFFLADFPLVIRTLQDRFPCDEICYRAMVLADEMEDFAVPAELSELDRAILKASIEKSRWLKPYPGQSKASKARYGRQLTVVRECAERLASIGIEVDELPT